jgi:WD40 repeat protein
MASFPGRFAPVRQVSWHADGQYLAAALVDKSLRIFAVAGAAGVAAIARFDQPVMSTQFSPDGQRIAVASGNFITIFALGVNRVPNGFR